MSSPDDREERILKALKEAYHNPDEPQFSGHFTDGVIRSVRQAAACGEEKDAEFVWKLAWRSGLVSAVLAAFLYINVLEMEHGFADFFVFQTAEPGPIAQEVLSL